MEKQFKRAVITGVGIVSPVGIGYSAFKEAIFGGKCGIAPITRFDTSDFKVKLAAEIKDFDPASYFSDRSEAKKCDRFTQFALAAATEAMTDSGYKICDPFRAGVYIGSGIGGMETFITQTNLLRDRGPSRVSPFFVPMMIGNMAAGMTAIRFGLRGPTLPITTACATSTNSIGEAYRAVRGGYADMIIAGGAEATINPLAVAGFQNSRALSESQDASRASIPFDRERSGFVMGEGAAVIIIEELGAAIKRGAKIYAEIIGYGNTCDAYHMTSPAPDASGAAKAIELCVSEAGISPSDTERLYINAHGTGTPLNDKAETAAIKLVFGENAGKIAISSTKSMTGHMLGAAGAVEAIASVCALESSLVPPTINLRCPDPECDLNYTPDTAVSRELNFALSVSLGFGGHNACIAMKKYEGDKYGQ